MSEKNRDDKNRWRNVTIAFRMSPEENEELNNRVKLSGFRTKQDYITQSVLHQKVVAIRQSVDVGTIPARTCKGLSMSLRG